MSDDEKLMWMFTQVHGEIKGKCYTELTYDDEENPIGVSVMKDGNLCWYKSKLDIVFEYLTKHLE
jgi:hypothetical protein